MVPERKPRVQPLRLTLRLASALAAILLVITFGAEFIFGAIHRPQEMAADTLVMMEAARAPEDAQPEPLIQWGPPDEMGVVNGMGGDSLAMEEPMLEMEPMPDEEAMPEMEILPQEQPETEEEAIEEVPDKAKPSSAKGDDLILGINTDEGGEIISRSEPALAQQQPESRPWPEILKWTQITLAVIAVGGGLTLLILRRRRHP